MVCLPFPVMGGLWHCFTHISLHSWQHALVFISTRCLGLIRGLCTHLRSERWDFIYKAALNRHIRTPEVTILLCHSSFKSFHWLQGLNMFDVHVPSYTVPGMMQWWTPFTHICSAFFEYLFGESSHWITTMWGPRSISKLVIITPTTMVYVTDSYSY